MFHTPYCLVVHRVANQPFEGLIRLSSFPSTLFILNQFKGIGDSCPVTKLICSHSRSQSVADKEEWGKGEEHIFSPQTRFRLTWTEQANKQNMLLSFFTRSEFALIRQQRLVFTSKVHATETRSFVDYKNKKREIPCFKNIHIFSTIKRLLPNPA